MSAHEPAAASASAAEQEGPASVGDDVVVFAKGEFTGRCEDKKVVIQLMRLGECTKPCSVELSTSGANKFHEAIKSKTIEFDACENWKDVTINLSTSKVWSPLEKIKARIRDPHGAKIGDTKHCDILLTDDQKFPRGVKDVTDRTVPFDDQEDSKMDDEVDDDKPQTKSSHLLQESLSWEQVKDFFWFQCQVRGEKVPKTIVALIFMGLYGVIDSIILKIVIDNALGDSKGDKVSWAAAVISIVILALLHKADVVQQDFRGRSGTRKYFRNAFVARYLHMSEASYEALKESDFMHAMVFQTESLVKDAWYSWLLLFKFGASLIGNTIFQLWLMSQTDIPLWILPVVLIFFVISCTLTMHFRGKEMLRLNLERDIAEDRWLAHAEDMVTTRELLMTYQKVERVTKKFEKVYEDFYEKHRASRFYQQTSRWIPKWIFGSLIFIMYGAAPRLVGAYGFSPGDFASMLKSWIKTISSVEKLYECQLKIQRCHITLEKISIFLNCETKAASLCKMAPKVSTSTYLHSYSKIVFEEVTLCDADNADVLKDISCEIDIDGKITMFEAGIDSDGHSAKGKATILRLIAGLIPPKKGLVLTATHKTFLYLDRYPRWVQGSILRNLRFGMHHHLRKSLDPNVCWAVVMACGLSPHHRESTMVIQPNKPHLLNEDAVAISLARAFLSMPDVLLVDAVGDVYGEPWITKNLLPLLRQYVKGGLREVVASFDAELAKQVPMPPFPPSIIWSSRQTSGSMGDQILRVQDHKLEVANC
eukprot:gnl/MRDRNA2_/MRDRNA2_81525_c0_seq2.p1 gnl/MRDRNA2_/MRDRNA2_81525_c0~~gnl/MRDRNA2_/MRDRNA2_81525_c0_seq2.p1  ORF type:complete len:883 (+),score=121.60 gnl/MRDRNA2_/MRDRNA2_81525_c0_seq2:363-2651(+)